ncbi:unnamed protein product [Candidula unifasciata]|uniref:Protein TBATA n=1 Tax=Candidula unifasciata TaxID=100452 RepID=A0A8S3YJG4_9EUPU|nr:unnamed protein product [Candidula unifasciata]
MATSEVFRPSNGDLLVRDALIHGPTLSADHFKKETGRPQTQGGYRFGQLSHNSFFTRHNPHPTRVRHIKGLLDVPICCVNDDGYFASPRYSLQFPPNGFDNQQLKHWRGRIPVSAINFNKRLNAIGGWQSLAGLNGYPFREKAIPKVGLVPITEAWRDELAAFTRALGVEEVLAGNKVAPVDSKPASEGRKRSTVYSPDTGRIIPPPSRAVSRGQSRKGQANNQFIGGNLQHISTYPDWENLVFLMLCQILQTEDTNAVQAWLCSAGEREKSLVMDLVKSALAGGEEYYRQYPAEFMDTSTGKLPPIHEKRGNSNGEVNRMTGGDERKGEISHTHKRTVVFSIIYLITEIYHTEPQKSYTPPILGSVLGAKLDLIKEKPLVSTTTEAVRSLPIPGRNPLTPLQPIRPPTRPRQQKIHVSKTSNSESKIKHTKSSFKDRLDVMWSQNQSVNTF